MGPGPISAYDIELAQRQAYMEAQRAAEEAAAAEYQRDNEAEDRMRVEEEARIQEALEELARSSDYATQGTVADYF